MMMNGRAALLVRATCRTRLPVFGQPQLCRSFAVKKGKKSTDGEVDPGSTASRAAKYKLMYEVLTLKLQPETDISDEEKARRYDIGHTYNVMSMKQHIAHEKAITRKIQEKQKAIDALPTEALRQEALNVDESLVPLTIPLTIPPPEFKLVGQAKSGLEQTVGGDDDDDEIEED